ncbi:hypothetical protein PR048_010870 [Dryococelus australis]|uniref:Brain-derived neurotrophic factor n=1 Tax=Dryococelus australis TaxID=614101 RepID=A0ABQ9I541_9NEOP|nr:hypothetical protein PR048_010870 [Dryococelus australis]
MAQCNTTLSKPEATLTTQLTAFSKELRQEKHSQVSQIYNVDESEFSTVPRKTPKVLSPVGNSRVMKLSSGERGQNVTAVCSYNKLASVGVAVKGSRDTGIEPTNDNIFKDADFEGSKTTDKPQSMADRTIEYISGSYCRTIEYISGSYCRT